MKNLNIKSPIFILSLLLLLVVVSTAIIIPKSDWENIFRINQTATTDITGLYDYTLSGGNATITAYHGGGGGVIIPSTLDGYPVTSIGNQAFYQNTELTSITIPDSVTSIGRNAFGQAGRGLTSVTIGSGVTSIGNNAFDSDPGLISIIIPDSVTSIGSAAFFYDTGLISVTIGSGVTSIGDQAFAYNTGLTSINIPDSLTSIGTLLFQNCSHLTQITANPDSLLYSSQDGVLFNGNKTTLILYPYGLSGSYVVPDSVTSIGNGAFAYDSGLTSIDIPDSVTSIGDHAFDQAVGLTSIDIPNSVTSIGDYAFSSDPALISINIGSGITSIGTYTFGGDTGLTSITIPDSVTSIGESAFYGDSALISVTIGSGVTSIGNGAFSNTRLTSITIPDSLTSIGSGAFAGMPGLTSITIPNSVTSIGDYAFDDDSALTSIVVGSGVTSVEQNAFADNPLLTSVYFLGNAPPEKSISRPTYDGVFDSDNYSNLTVYYVEGKSGWGATWNGQPTATFVPTNKEITAFSFDSISVTGVIDGTNISVTVPSGTNLTNLAATFTTTGSTIKVGATTQTSGETTNDFSNPVTYRVTAINGSIQDYTVTVTTLSTAAVSRRHVVVEQREVSANVGGATEVEVPTEQVAEDLAANINSSTTTPEQTLATTTETTEATTTATTTEATSTLPVHIDAVDKNLTITPEQSGTYTEILSTGTLVLDVPSNNVESTTTFSAIEQPLAQNNSVLYDIKAIDQNQNSVHNFSEPISISLPLPQALIGGQNLGVYYLNEVTNEWIIIPNATFFNGKVTFQVDHLTKFAIFGTPAETTATTTVEEQSSTTPEITENTEEPTVVLVVPVVPVVPEVIANVTPIQEQQTPTRRESTNPVSNFVSGGSAVISNISESVAQTYAQVSVVAQQAVAQTVVIAKETAKVTKEIIDSPAGSVVTKTVSTTGVVVGAGTAVGAIAVANPITLSELWLIPAKLFGLLLGAFGIRRKQRPWGTIYDSVTKRPLDPAYVSLINTETNKEVTGAITDIDGRYGFITLPGKYRIEAKKTNYVEPSQKMQGQSFDEVYNDLYFGEEITITEEGQIITKNIPMDSLSFDWNEFAKTKMNVNIFMKSKDILWARISKFFFGLGAVISIIAAVFAPAPYNLIVVLLYVATYILNYVVFKTKKSGVIKEKNTKIPLSFAVIKIYREGDDTVLTKKIADKFGNYYVLLPNGRYHLVIDKKNDDQSYSEVLKTPEIDVKKGIINLDLNV